MLAVTHHRDAQLDEKILQKQEITGIQLSSLGMVNQLRQRRQHPEVANEQDETVTDVIASALPPWHSVLLVSIFFSFFSWTIPSLELIDEIANDETLLRSLSGLSVYQIAVVRAAFACIIWCTSASCYFSNGWDVLPPYVKSSKLKRNVVLRLKGIKTMWPFTSWSWNLLGVWFSTSAYIGWSNGVAPKWAFRIAAISWEIAAPCTLLVAAVVRYILWPAALKKDPPVHALNSLRNILMHNMNVLMAVTECFLLSGMPVRWSDCSLAPLWGCVYVVFAWSISTSWARREDGPQFIYFFFDTTVPGFTPSIALALLLIVLLAFYGLFCSAEELTHYLGGGLAARLGLGSLLCFGVMRFKD